MGKKILLIVFLLIFAAIGYYAWQRYGEAVEKEKKAAEKKPEDPVVVNVVKTEVVSMLDERVYSGTTQAWSSYDVDPEVSAKLLSLKFDIGDAIHKNDLIAKLDDSNYVQAVRQAEAELEVSKAKFMEANEMKKLRHSEYERQSLLHASNATSYSEYESAEIAMKVQDATAAQCEAEIKNCEAKLAAARVKLADTEIRGEWTSGSDVRHVGERYVDEGTLVSPGKPMLKVIEIDRIKAKIPIIERDFRFLKVGQTAEITTDAFPGEIFEGTITNISNELSENTRNVIAVISIPNKDLRLRPGMFVRVRIVLAEHKNVQTVPPNAILSKYEKRGIFTIDRGTQTALFIPVETGLATRARVEIVSPVLNGPVVTVGNHMLENGKSVVISELSRLQMAEKLGAQNAAAQKPAQEAAKPGEGEKAQ